MIDRRPRKGDFISLDMRSSGHGLVRGEVIDSHALNSDNIHTFPNGFNDLLSFAEPIEGIDFPNDEMSHA